MAIKKFYIKTIRNPFKVIVIGQHDRKEGKRSRRTLLKCDLRCSECPYAMFEITHFLLICLRNYFAY